MDPKQTIAPVAVLLAPPGVLIGKFDARATKDQIAAALHKAGKCCDDPNCKHNRVESQGAKVESQKQPATARNPASTGRRN